MESSIDYSSLYKVYHELQGKRFRFSLFLFIRKREESFDERLVYERIENPHVFDFFHKYPAIIFSSFSSIFPLSLGLSVAWYFMTVFLVLPSRLYAWNMLNRVRGNSDHVSSPCKYLEGLMTIRKSTGPIFPRSFSLPIFSLSSDHSYVNGTCQNSHSNAK